jgi:thioredoxin 1
MTTLTQENFAQEVLESPQPILVDFWAEWCGPCKMLAPILEELATEYAGRFRIGKVDIEQQSALAVGYNIQAIPTLLIFDKGQVVEQVTGLRSKKDLKSRFDRVLG